MRTTVLTPSGGLAARNAKRQTWFLSVALPLLVPVSTSLFLLTGKGAWLYLPLLVIFAGIPLLDGLLGEDRRNPPESAVPALEADPFYRLTAWAAVPVIGFSFISNLWFLSTHALPTGLWAATVADTMTVGGLAIVLGHELGHKKGAWDRRLALFLLSLCGYGHFSVEHNRGHHRWVATPEDPASSRMGESLWRFAWRELPGAFFRAWDLEVERLEREGYSEWSLRNEIVQGWLMTAALYGGLVALFGVHMLPTFALIAFLGGFMLTMTNYIEHYGLLRRKLDNGRYEPTQPQHSWNSNHIVSNLVMFHLQRHSDHHAHPTRAYQSLRDFPSLPALPNGYFLMILVALVPPLWYALMDRRLVAAVGGDASRINFIEAKRSRLVRRYRLQDVPSTLAA